eukprot:scaffold61189_cov42-Prasinocladus_malaysianus.AAC.1
MLIGSHDDLSHDTSRSQRRRRRKSQTGIGGRYWRIFGSILKVVPLAKRRADGLSGENAPRPLGGSSAKWQRRKSRLALENSTSGKAKARRRSVLKTSSVEAFIDGPGNQSIRQTSWRGTREQTGPRLDKNVSFVLPTESEQTWADNFYNSLRLAKDSIIKHWDDIIGILLTYEYKRRVEKQAATLMSHKVASVKYVDLRDLEKSFLELVLSWHLIMHIASVWIYWCLVAQRIPMWAFWASQLLRVPYLMDLAAYFSRKELQTNVNVSTVASFKFIVMIFLSTHWIGCMFFFLAVAGGFDADPR